MRKNQEPYNIGLDIGTSSIGWSIMNDNFDLMRVKGKKGIGVRLYNEGQSAAERRMHRTARRRYGRRKWRLRLLEDFFDEHMAEVDDTFFARLKDSSISPKDDKKYRKSLLFPKSKGLTYQDDGEFYKKYPTMYHLRYALMTEHRKFDLREIYLAFHHMVKYRGNFLYDTSVDSFEAKNLDIKGKFDEINDLLSSYTDFYVDNSNAALVESILLEKNTTRKDKAKKIAKLLHVEDKEKGKNKKSKDLATQISNAVLGLKCNFHLIFELQQKYSFDLCSEKTEENIANLSEVLDENQKMLLMILKEIQDQVMLNAFVPSGMSLSEAMMQKYDDYGEQLKIYHELEHSVSDDLAAKLRGAYRDYNDNIIKRIDGDNKKDTFYKRVKNILTKISKEYVDQDVLESCGKLKKLIDENKLFIRQRTAANGFLPHQLHQIEMRKIIDNQKEYYPWLAEPNPNEKRRVYSKYKVEELIAFRIPYYVGPLVDPNNADKNKEARFSWMVRKKDGKITPWNFGDKVDRAESANNFIERMKSKDTYLLGEDVVPKESMLYQKYEVLNELNNVRINDNGLSDSFEDVKLKQAIYNDLFKKQKVVKVTELQNYLVQNHKYLVKPKISGLADENRFLSSLSTYSDLKTIFGDKVDDRTYFNDFEKMVEYSTVFEDGHVYNQKLDEFTWLTKEEKGKIGKKRYRGWGKLSKKLLTGLRDKNYHTIMDNLWETNRNFMQIQTSDEFPKQIAEENEKHLKGSVSDAINDMYTSPANKKAIRQVLRVVDDIQKAMGYAPSSISLEFAREDGPSVRTVSRANRMKSIYDRYAAEVSEEVMKDLDGVIKNKQSLNDRLYLYFEQQGKDIYSGHPLDFDKVISGQEYDIDHILPQAVIKDDSLDNRVLTTKALNNDVKSKGVPCRMFNGMHSFWKNLYDKGFISRRKFNNLTTDPENIDKYKMKGFVNRQLVETRQIIKLVANVLNDKYQNDDVDIIEVRAELTHDIRKHFKFYKNRNVNDYHHAFDAYLTSFVGQYLFKKYPNLRPLFDYNDFMKVPDNVFKQLHGNNFLGEFLNKSGDIISTDGNFVLNKEEMINKLNKAYAFKKMLVTKEVGQRTGAMFNETRYPAPNSRKAALKYSRMPKPDSLISVKDYKNTDIYGGYSGKNDAYMVIVDMGKQYMVVGVPVRYTEKLDKLRIKNSELYRDELREVLSMDKTLLDSKGNVKRFDIVLDRVLYDQLIEDGNELFTLGSSKYKRNFRQLFLDKQCIEILDSSATPQPTDEELIWVYDQILDKVDKYFELYDINRQRETLRKGRAAFCSLPNMSMKKDDVTKKKILNEILVALHANESESNCEKIGKKVFGRLQVPGGIKLSKEAKLIYQSPTGLFERVVYLKNL